MLIQQAIDELVQKKTVFIVAQSWRAYKRQVGLVLGYKRGICEAGTHDELIKNNGLYASLYNKPQKMLIH